VHLGPFGCLTKLGAKLGELVQKFENEVASEFFATNTPDPSHWTLKLCFGVIRTIWVHFGLFGFLTKIDAKRAVLVPKFVPQSRFGIFRNERILSTPLDPNLMFWCLSYYLGAFGTVWLSHESRGKTAELVQKSMKRSRAGNFHNERTRSTPSDPKLMFWCILYYFWCIWDCLVALRNSVQNGRTSEKVHATKSRRNFSQRTHPMHPIGP